MRVRFTGANGDRLEIIEIAPSRYQYIYLNGEDRGISKVVHGPIGNLVRESVALGWTRLSEDPVERQRDITERQRLAWLAKLNPNFKPAPLKPKRPYAEFGLVDAIRRDAKTKKTRVKKMEFTEIPLP